MLIRSSVEVTRNLAMVESGVQFSSTGLDDGRIIRRKSGKWSCTNRQVKITWPRVINRQSNLAHDSDDYINAPVA